MRLRFFGASALTLLFAMTGCGSEPSDDDDAAGGGGNPPGQGGSGAGDASGAGDQGGSGGGGAPADSGWQIVPIIDDESDPENIVYHSGNTLVTGIHFASLDDGYLVSAGDNGTFTDGGAVFRAARSEVTEVLFSGDETGTCLLGTVDFQGIVATDSGYMAMAHACDIISSKDDGESFGVERIAVGEAFGIEDVIGYRQIEGGATIVRDTGVVSVTENTPGPNAIWDDVWAPRANPPIPDPVPAEQCQDGPNSNNVPSNAQAVYVAPDAQFIAYTASPEDDPQVCISTDGGVTFFPSRLSGVAEDVLVFAPTGVLFTSATDGIVWHASDLYPGAAYIYRTTDAGETWTKVELPSSVADKSIELRQAFFAPDGQHGWIVGYNYDNSIALMIRTTDGGATWDATSGDLAAKVSEAGGGKLSTGFALDENNIWVGGEYGVFLYNANGGQ